MVIVPMGQKDCSQAIRRDADRLQTLEEVPGVGIHADIHRDRSGVSGD